jgi:hypothetical protein
MREGGTLTTGIDRAALADAGARQTHLPANAKAVKRSNSQTGLRANSTTVKRATYRTYKRLNGQTGLWPAGGGEQTGLPANVKPQQQNNIQTLKQG